ncbi:MAG TPA: NAD-dependent epimerase/dehydratase family protein, partial [Solirubrobacteraceae bacterium]
GVIPIFVRKALAGEPVTIAGEGLQSRRFVYVEDLADGVVRGLAAQAGGRVYNLVGDESVTVRGIADAVGDLLGGVEIVHTPARNADFQGAEVCGARAARELGWQPRTSFNEGVRRYIEWHRAQTPDPDAAAVAPARAARHGTPRLSSIALSSLTLLAMAGVLAAYLTAVHAIGLTGAEDRTVAVLSVATLTGYLATALGGPTNPSWTVAGWAIAAAGVIVVYTPETRNVLALAGPDESRVLLALAGGALTIGIAGAGLRLRRGGHDRLATDGRP